FVIDGVDVSNVRNAALGRESAIPFEFVSEIQVQSGGFEAAYGGATGGVINVITKSGTNDFHGEGALMLTGSQLNSRPRGFWQRLAANQSQPEFFRQKEDEYRNFFPIFTLGGPIIKDRLHFFTSYAPDMGRTERTIPFTAGTKTTTQRVLRHYGIARVPEYPLRCGLGTSGERDRSLGASHVGRVAGKEMQPILDNRPAKRKYREEVPILVFLLAEEFGLRLISSKTLPKTARA